MNNQCTSRLHHLYLEAMKGHILPFQIIATRESAGSAICRNDGRNIHHDHWLIDSPPNLIRVEHDEFGAMKLQDSAVAVFKKERSITLRKDRIVTRNDRKTGSDKPLSRSGLSLGDQEIFEVLRQERLAISREQGVAPYVVFPDTTLIALATQRPTRLEDMLEISGIGPTKLNRYGQRFLQALETAVLSRSNATSV